MQCPVCTTERLVMTDRQGIEIDYCPKCRGVWLDRGELDKIVERAAGEPARPPRPAEANAVHEPQRPPERPYDRDPRDAYARRRDDDDDDDDYRDRDRRHGRGHRRKSFLGDLFDFD